MASLIPSLGSARFDSRGELRLAERLKDFLEENACIWHNLAVGPRGRHPDFVIVHPANGLLVLEVKDWRLDNIVSANKSDVELLTPSGTVRTASPFEQARRYMFDVVQMIQRDGMLLHPPGHAFAGKLIVPFGFGVVLITQAIRADRPGRRLPRRPLRVQRRNDRERRCGSVPYPAVENGVAAIGRHLRPCPSSTDCAR